MRRKLTIKDLSTDDFEYNKSLRLFKAPLSKWGFNYWDRIYLTNPKTSKVICFYLIQADWCGSKRYKNNDTGLTLVLTIK